MIYPTSWTHYELLDFGNGRKLEQFGSVIIDRPEPAATQAKAHPNEWGKADIRFTEKKGQKGEWDKTINDWEINYPFGAIDLKFKLSQGSFKHPGVFPEQAVNWNFIADRCTQFQGQGVEPRILNLFAYTGGASVAGSLSGAQVTHVDSSKSVVNWARENAELNHIQNIRWIVEDARKFVDKCIRRGETYHGIIMDPPIFGMVPKGKAWKLNKDLAPLIEKVMQILDTRHRFFIMNTYSPQLPLDALIKLLGNIEDFPKQYEHTTLGLQSKHQQFLPLGNLIRF